MQMIILSVPYPTSIQASVGIGIRAEWVTLVIQSPSFLLSILYSLCTISTDHTTFTVPSENIQTLDPHILLQPCSKNGLNSLQSTHNTP
jgi:hypothetical protein